MELCQVCQTNEAVDEYVAYFGMKYGDSLRNTRIVKDPVTAFYLR